MHLNFIIKRVEEKIEKILLKYLRFCLTAGQEETRTLWFRLPMFHFSCFERQSSQEVRH